MSTGPAGSGEAIFKPDLDQLRSDVTRRFYARLVMTDLGDHVEWADGKRTTAMRLPDQPPSDRFPLLHTVLIASFKTYASFTAPGRVQGCRVRFLDESGAVIAWLGPRVGTDVGTIERMLPDAAYAPLVARGVTIAREVFLSSDASFYDRHPDPRVTFFARSFAVHPALWVMGPILAVLVIVFAVLAATGYFSS